MYPSKLSFDSIKQKLAINDDIVVERIVFREQPPYEVEVIYCHSIVDVKALNTETIPLMYRVFEQADTDFFQHASAIHHLQAKKVAADANEEDVIQRIFSGYILFYDQQDKQFIEIELPQFPKRKPEESNTEISFRGPRDGFTEDVEENIALVRKRLRTSSLVNESYIVGKRGQVQLSLLYMKDIVRDEILNEVRKQIEAIDTDAVLSLAEVEERLTNTKFTFFPLTVYSSRPDFISSCLDNGRVAILIDGSPGGIIAPVNLMFLLKTAEDLHNSFISVGFQRLLRMTGLLLALFLPGLWIALNTFHVDQLPLPFLATIYVSRLGLPLSSVLEIFLMIALFELFREAGTTLPKSVGQTLAVVGGLIIGDAAIRAGLTSPTMLVVVGLTVVSTFAITSQVLSGTVSLIRIYVLMLSAFLGMFGFCIAVISIIVYLASLESFGLPYLSPLSPFNKRDFISGVFVKPWKWRKRRPANLKAVDSTRRKFR
ncbi:spore germination protein [Shouchella miscanthi]|uniref:spore germination protein n=1 Tax=Shouchella miscanthi TaxID=2598861 RepID=UPI0011A84E48|nr:spore germination protein [Shouchella miscanthi]